MEARHKIHVQRKLRPFPRIKYISQLHMATQYLHGSRGQTLDTTWKLQTWKYRKAVLAIMQNASQTAQLDQAYVVLSVSLVEVKQNKPVVHQHLITFGRRNHSNLQTCSTKSHILIRLLHCHTGKKEGLQQAAHDG